MSNALKKNRFLYAILPFFFVAQILAIRRLLKTYEPDLIHAHWIIPQGLCCVLALTMKSKKPKVLITSHGGDLYGYRGKLLNRLKRWVISQSDTFSVVSEAMREYVNTELTLSSDNIPIMPMGADLDVTFVPDESVLRQKGQLIFVGRLVEKKGLKYLIQAMPELVRNIPQVNLIVVGSGPELPKLKSLCDSLGVVDRVHFLGKKSHPSIAKLFQQSEVAIFPFTQAHSGDMEGLGLVVIEAMGCKCPVIVGDVPAVYDTVKHNDTGLLVDPENKDDLAYTIYNLHTDSRLRDSLSSNGNQFVIENFSWKKCTERYKRAFTELLSSN